MEPLLGMPAGSLPRNSEELDAYMREMLAGGNIVVTDTSRALARAMLYPPRWNVAWPAFRAMQLLTIGTLPPVDSGRLYGFERAARDKRAFARWMALLRTSRRWLPPSVREWPAARGAERGSFELSGAPGVVRRLKLLDKATRNENSPAGLAGALRGGHMPASIAIRATAGSS